MHKVNGPITNRDLIAPGPITTRDLIAPGPITDRDSRITDHVPITDRNAF